MSIPNIIIILSAAVVIVAVVALMTVNVLTVKDGMLVITTLIGYLIGRIHQSTKQ
jgi:hypothetical protein